MWGLVHQQLRQLSNGLTHRTLRLAANRLAMPCASLIAEFALINRLLFGQPFLFAEELGVFSGMART